ncbi:MAG: VWA domain-containing protein [Chloroflexota bacterium]
MKIAEKKIWERPSVDTGVSAGDIKRAILGGGDVSAFTEPWHKFLRASPVPTLAALAAPVTLPESAALIRQTAGDLEPVVTAWIEGKELPTMAKAKIDLTLVGLPPHGRNVGRYLERMIDEMQPDIIAVDTTPLFLSAEMLYAFSLPCAVGLPAYGQIMSKDLGYSCAGMSFYPGNMCETAIVKGWFGKIPLLPIGVPTLAWEYSESDYTMTYMDKSYADKNSARPLLLSAYRALDEALDGITGLEGNAAKAMEISQSLMKSIGSKLREDFIDEACYLGSRLMDLAPYISTLERPPRILVLVDLTHYADLEDAAKLLKLGVADEIYTPPKSNILATEAVLVNRNPDKLDEEAQELIPETSLMQELFRQELDRLMKDKGNEALSESELDKLIPLIVNHTRHHPDVAHGASVRGTIALKEVLDGLSLMRGGLTRDNLAKAALITLPPRMTGKQKDNETDVVADIAKEALYQIHFSPSGSETVAEATQMWISPEDIMKSLKDLKPLSDAPAEKAGQKNLPAIVADPNMSQELLKRLESQKLLKKGANGQYSMTKRAIDFLINDLEDRFKSGSITRAQYALEKDRLTQMLKQASKTPFKMSAKDLANTIMEMMDAQDKQWNSQVSFERMHIYYHVKENKGGMELSPEKKDYYGLKMLIDGLEEQGILRATEKADFNITGEALDILLDYLISGDNSGRGLEGAIDKGKTLVHERKQEVRKFTSGDVFRDISVRHTLQEIARQRKDLSSLKQGDFRVFMKQRRKLQSDIVICMDISGSMGFQHKMIYARLAAAGLIKAAIDNGDRIGAVAFNNSGDTMSPLTDKDKETLTDYIVKLSPKGNTNIGDGIRCAAELLNQGSSRNQKYIILITDGEPTAISQNVFNQIKEVKEKDLTEESALLETKKAAAKGIRLSVIHIATEFEASGEFIRNVARIGQGKVRRMSSPDDLKAIIRGK